MSLSNITKVWDECSIEEKVDRLRIELHSVRCAVARLFRQTRHLEEHQHATSGNILIPLRREYGQGEEASSRDMLA